MNIEDLEEALTIGKKEVFPFYTHEELLNYLDMIHRAINEYKVQMRDPLFSSASYFLYASLYALLDAGKIKDFTLKFKDRIVEVQLLNYKKERFNL